MSDPVNSQRTDPGDTPTERHGGGDTPSAATPDASSLKSEKTNESNGDGVEALAQLRHLLLGPEQHEIETIRNRIDNSDLRADDVAGVLPEAVSRSVAQNDRLAKALAPSIGSAIKTSVQKDPTPLVDAIFPIIGPAIRRSISDALSGMMQSLNQAMEHSLSVQGLRWRIEAARSGKPFAEVVLLHTLQFRVEQVFLIHPETGLLLHHVGVDGAPVADERMVSGMITAIQDFVRDSFGGKDEQLDRMRVGGMVVRIERGPSAVLAAVIRGAPSSDVSTTMQEAIEQIHREYADKLDAFEGDVAPFEDTSDVLERCLLHATQNKIKPKVSPGPVIAIIIFTVLMGSLIYWRASRASHWSGYIEELRSTPGLVVIEEDRGWSTHRVSGLRDPLASDPYEFLEAHDITPDKVDANWRMFESLDPSIAALRHPQPPDPETELLRIATGVLQPPDGITLSVSGTTITIKGDASHAWIASAKAESTSIPGLGRLDLSGVGDLDLYRARVLIDDIQGRVIPFDSGRTDVDQYMAEQIADIARLLIELTSVTGVFDAGLVVRVVGHSDPAGDETNRNRISLARAEYVLTELLRHNPGLPTMTAVGLGSSQPIRADQPGDADRRVSFVVEMKQAGRN